jgi:hypothetical protein
VKFSLVYRFCRSIATGHLVQRNPRIAVFNVIGGYSFPEGGQPLEL